MRVLSLPKDDERTTPRPARPNIPAATRLVALTSGFLACLGAFADAGPPEAVTGEAEFIEFLEYLGSWDGAEEDWVQFLPALEQTSILEAADGEVEHPPESASL